MDENIENDTASFEKKCIAAYYLWLARGCGNGYDKADWFAAEALLKLSPAVRSNAYPPSYSYINTATIRSSLSNPYFDTNRFFLPTNTWIEISQKQYLNMTEIENYFLKKVFCVLLIVYSMTNL
jgi:hypothetical protein